MGGADPRTQDEQQDRARNDERHADKGFRKGDGEGDGKDPIGMALSGKRHPFAGVMHKPVKNAEHAVPVLVGGSSRPEAHIAVLGSPRQSETFLTYFPVNRWLYMPPPI